MKQKDVLLQRKSRKDEMKKKRRRKRFTVGVRYTASREFTIMAYDEKEAVIRAVQKLHLLEPPNTNVISALICKLRGNKVYDTHLDLDELNALDRALESEKLNVAQDKKTVRKKKN